MATSIHIASLGLGSNVGNRLGNIELALKMLASHARIQILRRSSLYESAAHVLSPDDTQRPYVNAACLIETQLTPKGLLQECLALESAQGRVRSNDVRWLPRTLDIDILHYDDLSVSEPDLIIPHPRLASRRFVLVPLFEIAPDLNIPPPFEQSVQYLLEHCRDYGPVTRYPAKQATNSKE